MAQKKGGKQEKRESMLTASDWKKSLQVEIRRVRSLVKEIAANYVSKLEGRAEDLARIADEVAMESKEEFQRIIKRFRALNVKPHKGRRKDLRQLEDLIDSLRTDMESMGEKQEKSSGDKKPHREEVARRGKRVRRSTRRGSAKHPGESSGAESPDVQSGSSGSNTDSEEVPTSIAA